MHLSNHFPALNAMTAQAGSLSLPWMQPALCLLLPGPVKGVVLRSVYAPSLPAVRRWTVRARAWFILRCQLSAPRSRSVLRVSAHVLATCLHWWLEGHRILCDSVCLAMAGRLGSSLCHCFHSFQVKHTHHEATRSCLLCRVMHWNPWDYHWVSAQAYIVIWWKPPQWIPFPVFFFLPLGITHSGIQTGLELWASLHGHQEQNATGDDQPYLRVPPSYQSVSAHVRTLLPLLGAFAVSTKEFQGLPRFWAPWFF